MPRSLRLPTVLLILSLTGSEASAQHRHGGYGGGAVAMTPFGPIMNPGMSPDYMLFVRNPLQYEQVMLQREQRMMAAQQKQAMQYQQAMQREMQKEMKAYQDWAKKNPEQAAAMQKRWIEMNTPRARHSKTHKPKTSLGRNGLPKPKDAEASDEDDAPVAKAKTDKAKPAAEPTKDAKDKGKGKGKGEPRQGTTPEPKAVEKS